MPQLQQIIPHTEWFTNISSVKRKPFVCLPVGWTRETSRVESVRFVSLRSCLPAGMSMLSQSRCGEKQKASSGSESPDQTRPDLTSSDSQLSNLFTFRENTIVPFARSAYHFRFVSFCIPFQSYGFPISTVQYYDQYRSAR